MVIDTRETALTTVLSDTPAPPLQKMLDLGDIHFVWNDRIVAIVERKTLSDLSASITDKRFYEQKSRLLEYYRSSGSRIIYMVEMDEAGSARLPLETLESCMLGIFLNDPVQLIQTKSLQDTADWLCKIQAKLEKMAKKKPLPTIFLPVSPQSQSAPTEDIVLPKKNKNALENPFLFVLTSVPGIGKTVAEPIIQEYKTVARLCEAFSAQSGQADPQYLLADIEIAGKKRKVGKVASEKIYKAFGYGHRANLE